MSLVNAKCTNCGANVQADTTKEACICQYCNSAYITEKAVSAFDISNTVNVASSGNTIQIIHNYASADQRSQPAPTMLPPRPRLNGGLFVLGLIFYIFPGILYYAYVSRKKHKWDAKYGNYR